jgi:hypothetical protein
METDPLICSTTTCQDVALYRVYWPGTVPVPQMCRPCALRARAVARAMGFALAVELMDSARPRGAELAADE